MTFLRPRLCRWRCHLCDTAGYSTDPIRTWLNHLNTHLGPNRRKRP